MRGLRGGAIALMLGLLAVLPVPARGTERVVVTLGDSLTAGLGVAADEAWPALIESRLRREGYAYRVVNAGVSGDTTAGGLRRVDWVLRNRPEVAVVERLRAGGARVLVAGMQVPPNYGAAYARAFSGVFPDVARRTGSPLVPFLLDGVAADPRLNQPDGIHPNAAGHRAIAEHIWPHLVALLTR